MEEKSLSRRRQLKEIQRMETCFKDGITKYIWNLRERDDLTDKLSSPKARNPQWDCPGKGLIWGSALLSLLSC